MRTSDEIFESLYGEEGEYRSEDYIRTTTAMKVYAVEAINELSR